MDDSSTHSKKTADFLQEKSSELAPLFTKFRHLESLNQRFGLLLDPKVREYCQVADYANQRLIVITANASIAMDLRFKMTQLLIDFKQDPLLKEIRAIEFKVRPPFRPQLPTDTPTGMAQHHSKKMQPISEKTAETIREMAKSISDPALREIMEKIAKNT